MTPQEDEYKQYYTPHYEGSPIDYNAAAQPEIGTFEAFMEQLRPKVDPEVQAKQDRQLATGRAFWAGANMLGNVISNIMNVNAVKAGAPSAQTYNSDAENRMYQQWKDVDNTLRAERRAAQDRYDAAGMSLAKLKSGVALKEAEQQQKIANANEKIGADNKRLGDAMAATKTQHPDWTNDDIYNYVTSHGRILPESYIDEQEKKKAEAYVDRYNKTTGSNKSNTKSNTKSYTVQLGGYNFDAGSAAGMAYVLGNVQSHVARALNNSDEFKKAPYNERESVRKMFTEKTLTAQKLQEIISKYDLGAVAGFNEQLANLMGGVYVEPQSQHRKKKVQTVGKATKIAGQLTNGKAASAPSQPQDQNNFDTFFK